MQTPGDIEVKIEQITKKAYDKKQTVQPYLVVEGAALETIRTTYIVIDKIKYQFLSTIEAFDILFKTYHALHIQYPPQSAHILQLIQNAVYGIKTKYDKIYPENLEILNLFQN